MVTRFLAVAIVLLIGAGSKSPTTVYVPLFESESHDRCVRSWVTELVVEEIKKLDGYKIVGTPEAAEFTIKGKLYTESGGSWCFLRIIERDEKPSRMYLDQLKLTPDFSKEMADLIKNSLGGQSLHRTSDEDFRRP